VTPDLISAIADLVRSMAWPAAAVFGVVFFRDDIRALAIRLRKGGPAEFDPPSQALAAGAESSKNALTLPTVSAALANIPTSPATATWENSIKELDVFKAASSPAEREAVLARIAARAVVTMLFEIVESNIYASQIALVTYLNANRSGVLLTHLKVTFYDKAVQQHPSLYANYPFEPYLDFLQRHGLVTVDAVSAKINPQGIEYLAWRIEQGKPPRLVG
jgi:hypothetical protein